jgi:hypothetical protein
VPGQQTERYFFRQDAPWLVRICQETSTIAANRSLTVAAPIRFLPPHVGGDPLDFFDAGDGAGDCGAFLGGEDAARI